MESKQLRQLFKDFFVSKGHRVIGSASVIPENDPSVLFTTAGMHPLVPYLLGEKHPQGKRLVNVQKCIRTGDIDEVGDASHCTFFEMLGNWSLGDFFKKEQIEFSYEFLTKHLKINPDKLAVTVFKGDSDCPADNESAEIWLKMGIKRENIFYLDKKHNWWGPVGNVGPCGPDTEMFIISDKEKCGKDCSPACNCGKYLEIWNDVFMQYNKTEDSTYEPLKQKNVDTGMGLERTLLVLNNKKTVYETDLFTPIIDKIEQLSQKKYGENNEETRYMRILADHIRTAVHIIGDERGIVCSNVDQGYILRRLIRRAIRFSKQLGIQSGSISKIALVVIDIFKEEYPELQKNRQRIIDEIDLEEARFEKTVNAGLKEFEKLVNYIVGGRISGKACFKLYDTYGFPFEMTKELALERGLTVDKEGFDACYKEHQQKSQSGAEQKFKGGLIDNTVATSRLHTATHLLHKALKVVLKDESVNQKGSNITEERLRFDFNFNRPLTKEEIEQIESLVNQQISLNSDIICNEMTIDEAKKLGAMGLFESKYGEKVKVYRIGDFSIEICGGPHAQNTSELGSFKIVKEQSSSAGIRRIKAVLTS